MSKYLHFIIKTIDTQTSRAKGTSGNKNFKVTQQDIDTYGRKEIFDTVSMLVDALPPDAIHVKWLSSGGIVHDDVKSFSVRKEYIDELYKLGGLRSSTEKMQKERDKITFGLSTCHTPWLLPYYNSLLDRLDRGNLPQTPYDTEFFRALNIVAGNTEPNYLRIFSKKIFPTTKVFENQYESKVCTVIKKYHPDLVGCGKDLSDNDILRKCNIFTYSNYFEFKGPCEYEIDGNHISNIGHTCGITFNTDTILKVQFSSFPGVTKVMTLENKANYYRLPYDPHALYIFVHGFLAPIEVSLCKQVAALLPDAEYYHWGDLDFGGIRIFKFLKHKVFPGIKPYRMDETSYARYQSEVPGYYPEKNTLKLLKDIDAEELTPLKELILNNKGQCFEQEHGIWD